MDFDRVVDIPCAPDAARKLRSARLGLADMSANIIKRTIALRLHQFSQLRLLLASFSLVLFSQSHFLFYSVDQN